MTRLVIVDKTYKNNHREYNIEVKDANQDITSLVASWGYNVSDCAFKVFRAGSPKAESELLTVNSNTVLIRTDGEARVVHVRNRGTVRNYKTYTYTFIRNDSGILTKVADGGSVVEGTTVKLEIPKGYRYDDTQSCVKKHSTFDSKGNEIVEGYFITMPQHDVNIVLTPVAEAKQTAVETVKKTEEVKPKSSE